MPDDALDLDMNDLERRMEGALSSLKSEFASLRTGRASANLLDSVMVDAYGASTPLGAGWNHQCP